MTGTQLIVAVLAVVERAGVTRIASCAICDAHGEPADLLARRPTGRGRPLDVQETEPELLDDAARERVSPGRKPLARVG